MMLFSDFHVSFCLSDIFAYHILSKKVKIIGKTYYVYYLHKDMTK